MPLDSTTWLSSPWTLKIKVTFVVCALVACALLLLELGRADAPVRTRTAETGSPAHVDAAPRGTQVAEGTPGEATEPGREPIARLWGRVRLEGGEPAPITEGASDSETESKSSGAKSDSKDDRIRFHLG